MSGLSEFREQYPQYDDVSDLDLANSLHDKFYSDIPKDKYLADLGVSAPKTGLLDSIKSAFSGDQKSGRRAEEAYVPQEISDSAKNLAGDIGTKLNIGTTVAIPEQAVGLSDLSVKIARKASPLFAIAEQAFPSLKSARDKDAEVVRAALSSRREKLQAELSPEQQSADAKPWLQDGSSWGELSKDGVSAVPGKLAGLASSGKLFGEGSTDLRKIMGSAVESFPGTIAAMGPVSRMAGAAGEVAYAAAVAKGASAELASIARTKAAEKVAMVAGGLAEGAQGAGSANEQTRKRVMDMPAERLAESPYYQAAVSSGLGEVEARIAAADAAATTSAGISFLFDSTFGALGDKYLGSAAAGKGTRAGSIGRGLVQETPTEAVQSAGEKFGENLGVKNFADPTQSLSEGVGEEAVGGGLTGGVTGGAMGGGLHRSPSTIRSTPEQTVANITDPAKTLDQSIAAAAADLDATGVGLHADLKNALRDYQAQSEQDAISTADQIKTPTGVINDSTLPIIGQESAPVGAQPIVSGNEDTTVNAMRQAYGDALAKKGRGELLNANDAAALAVPPETVSVATEPSTTKQAVEPNNGTENKVDLAKPKTVEQQALASQEAETPKLSTDRSPNSEQLFTEETPVFSDEDSTTRTPQGATANAASNQTAETIPQQAEQQEAPDAPVANPHFVGKEVEAPHIALMLKTAPDVKVHQVADLASLPTATEATTGKRMSRHTAAGIKSVMKLVGRDVQFYESSQQTHEGINHDGKTIYVNVDGGVDAMAVAGHEFTHSLKHTDPETYDAAHSAAVELLKADPDRSATYAKYLSNPDITAENHAELAHELLADIGGNEARTGQFWGDVFDKIHETHAPTKARGIITKIRDALVKFIDKLIGATPKKGFEHGFKREELTAIREHLVKMAHDSFVRNERQRLGLPDLRTKAKADAATPSEDKPAQEKQTPARLFFEVAPDPRNAPLKAAWDKLSNDAKGEVSDKLAKRIIPQVLDVLGAKGHMEAQLGGWMDDTSPSFALVLEEGDAGTVAKAIGHVLKQEAMYVTSLKSFDMGDRAGIIEIDVGPDATQEKIHEIYMKVRAISPDKIKGHSTIGRVMHIWVPLDGIKELSLKESLKVGKEHPVYHAEAYSAEINEKDYGYASIRGTPSRQPTGQRSDVDFLKTEAEQSFRSELDKRGIRPSPDRGYVGPEDRNVDSGSRGSVDTRTGQGARLGSVDVTGVHFSKEPRTHLSGVYFGTGGKSSEASRIAQSNDSRIKSRIYAYVNEGNGVTPETENGVGPHAHKAKLDNLYDVVADPLDFRPKHPTNMNSMESAILDAGFDGYYRKKAFGDQGVAILMGQAATNGITPEYKGTEYRGKELDVPPVGEASNFGKLQQSVMANNSLPGGEMTGSDWKRMMPKLMPEIDVSHLDDSSRYYKDQLVQRPRLSAARLAPNGKPSKLDEKQYAQVRTKEFKAWFGDWEAAHNGQDGNGVWIGEHDVSKVVDDNGEPLVVYHGTKKGGFTTFSPDKGNRDHSPMIFAAATRDTDRTYSGRGKEIDLSTFDEDSGDFDTQSGIYPLFLNIREPNEANFDGANWDGQRLGDQFVIWDSEDGEYVELANGAEFVSEDEANAQYEELGGDDVEFEGRPRYEVQNAPDHYDTTNGVAEEAKRMGNDGAIIRQVVDDGGQGGSADADDVFVFFDSNQAKSATQNTGSFSTKTDDIRLSPARKALEWKSQSENAYGPVYQGDGFTLEAIKKHDTTDDFTGDRGLPWGHVAHVEGDAYRFSILDDRRKPIGGMDAEVNGLGEISAIHDMKIQSNRAGAGFGTKVVETIMASTYDGVRVIDVLPQSEKFWDRLGAGYYDINKNTRLDFDGSPAEARYNDARSGDVRAQESEGTTAEAGKSEEVRHSTPRYEVPRELSVHRALDREELSTLRRTAADLERPQDGVFLRVDATGVATATGPKGTRIPDAFRRFAHIHDLAFYAERRVPKAPDLSKGEGDNAATAGSKITHKSEPMPIAYRESGARYFGEDVGEAAVRTDKTRFSTPRFVSQLATQIDKVPDRLAVQPGKQWLAWIQSNAAKLGIKKDEITWSGLNDYLELKGKEKVTKAEIGAFLSENGTQVKDVVLGAPITDLPEGWTVEQDKYGNWQVLNDKNVPVTTPQRSRDGALSGVPKTVNPTKFTQYVVPGGENYRELLVTLPSDLSYEVFGNDGEVIKSGFRDQGAARSYADTLGYGKAGVRKSKGTGEGTFRSSHFDQANILVHLRMDERTDADGNPTLFLQELQSDWGQKGKKEGFAEKYKAADIVATTGSQPNLFWYFEVPGNTLQIPKSKYATEAEARAYALTKNTTGATTPLATFVTDTKSWVALGIKKAIMYAVQHGMARVAWANGEQNAGHYSLEKKIGKLEWLPTAEGVGSDKAGVIRGWDTNGKNVLDKNATENDLPDIIGKEIAEKIVGVNPSRFTGSGKPVHTLEGIDLKVGGEGMRTFYDTIVPQVANEVLKKLGGGRVENIQLSDASFNTKTVADDDALLADLGVAVEGTRTATQQGFTITDSMLEKVSEGVPLFSTPRITGDSGRKYTKEQQELHTQTGREVNPKTVMEKLKAWANQQWIQHVFDQFDPIKSLDYTAYRLTRQSKGATGAFEALMNHGKLSIKDGAFDADMTGGVIKEVFAPIGKETTDFLYWVAGNRAERLAMEGKERLFTPANIAAAKSLADGTTDFDYILPNGNTTRDRTLIYKDTLIKFNGFSKNVMDMAEQSGLIDGASRHLWEHEFYVPFYRIMEEKDGSVRGMNIKKGIVRQTAFKKLKGGKEGLNDLLSNTLMNWAHLIDAAAKNRAAKATLDAAELNGAARPAKPGESGTVWYSGDYTRTLAKGTAYEENGVQKISDGTVKIQYHGKVEFVVDDPALLKAINSLDYVGLRGPMMDILTKPKHWLTMGVTASPFFKVRNLVRDSIQAIGVSDLSYNVLGNLKEGWALTHHDRQEYVSALAGGGLIRFGTMLEGNDATRTRDLIAKGASKEHILDSPTKIDAFYDTMRKLWRNPLVEGYNELGNRSEEMNRMALYNQLRKQGVSHGEAAFQARDLMDFSMQGSSDTVRFLTQVVPFMNARLQGMYKLGRAAKEDKAKFGIVLASVAVAGLALMAYAAGDEDRWKKWKQREEWDKDNYFYFSIGEKEYRIPRPFEIGAVASLAERTIETSFLDNEQDKWKRFGKAILNIAESQLSMNPVPQALKPIAEVFFNYDVFRQRPIESMAMDRLDSEYRFNSNTSMPARGLSTAIGGALSPVQIDHLVKGYFSWLGAFSVGAADMLIRSVNSEPTKPSLDYWKFATGGMVQEGDSASSRYVSQMYDQAKVLEEAHGTLAMLRKTGKTEEAAAYQQDNVDKLKSYNQVESVKKVSAKFNERIRMIERSALDADEKKVRISDIRKQQKAAAERLYVK